ncbi:cytochrome b [Methylophaga lonarensis MPL]|uniref:Cytochrome b n=1 Tax=Methylophaga lonarensis MPL TaxID=1286106 RepID=M7PU48_9GAMM|nr:cytochrome b/b6 domain-containing protein [Methylophaga lonarensis]EMR13989.1 cytochrome b [Methylophaga lonarensis MPL]
MTASNPQQQTFVAYKVWDLPVRLFHWIAVISLLAMIASGIVMMFSSELGISREHKVLLKAFHIWVGYVFVINLLIRLLWAFVGNRYARWLAILPFGKAYKAQWKAYLEAKKSGEQVYFLGHNPLGRWSVMAMLILMLGQGGTGLVLGSTDLFMPPFGNQMKTWIAESPESMALIKPGDRSTGISQQGWDEMREFRTPYRSLHTYLFYLLMLSIVVHIAAVVVAEKRERTGLTSAMITGHKYLPKKPFDAD